MTPRIWLGLGLALVLFTRADAKPKGDAGHDALLAKLAFGMPAQDAIATIEAVAHHPAPADVTALVRYAGHHDARVRGAALVALASYPDPLAHKAIANSLRDMSASVRGAAATAAAKGRVREAIEPLFALLARGEEPAGKALAALADVELARKLGDQLGKVPDGTLAQTLGLVLAREDFGPDPVRVEVVRAIGKIQHPQAVVALAAYVAATAKTAPRDSRAEAQKMVEARNGGGK